MLRENGWSPDDPAGFSGSNTSFVTSSSVTRWKENVWQERRKLDLQCDSDGFEWFLAELLIRQLELRPETSPDLVKLNQIYQNDVTTKKVNHALLN